MNVTIMYLFSEITGSLVPKEKEKEITASLFIIIKTKIQAIAQLSA